MNKINNVNKFKKLSLILVLCSIMGINGCGSRKNERFDTVIDNVSSDTYFDDVIDEDVIKQVSDLEEYIKISNNLNKMNLLDNTSMEDYFDSYLMSPWEINYLIDEYENCRSINRENISKKLYIQNKYVNDYLHDYGYDIMSYVTLIGFKVRIADAGKMDMDKINSLRVPSQDVYDAYRNNSLFGRFWINDYDISSCSDLTNLLESIYDMQNNASNASKDNGSVEYNRDRNKLLMNAINNLKKIYSNEYEVNKKRIRKI